MVYLNPINISSILEFAAVHFSTVLIYIQIIITSTDQSPLYVVMDLEEHNIHHSKYLSRYCPVLYIMKLKESKKIIYSSPAATY